MKSAAHTGPESKTMLWTGRIVGTLAVFFMLFDAVLHLTKPAPVVAAFAQLGFPLNLAVGIGILELVCVALYVIPRTSLLGAILLTGYLGGAMATQLRVGHAFETVFPVIIGALFWGGLYFRSRWLRAIFPLRTDIETS